MNNIQQALAKINYSFLRKPLVMGGIALEHYGIKNNKDNIEFIVSQEDWVQLKDIYPNNINLFGIKHEKEVNDYRISLKNIDLIKTVFQHGYEDLCCNHTEILKDYKIIGLNSLLLVKTLSAVYNNNKRSIEDQKLIVNHIIKNKI